MFCSGPAQQIPAEFLFTSRASWRTAGGWVIEGGLTQMSGGWLAGATEPSVCHHSAGLPGFLHTMVTGSQDKQKQKLHGLLMPRFGTHLISLVKVSPKARLSFKDGETDSIS